MGVVLIGEEEAFDVSCGLEVVAAADVEMILGAGEVVVWSLVLEVVGAADAVVVC